MNCCLAICLLVSLFQITLTKFTIDTPYKKGQRVSICFADCDSCSFTNRQCETCYSPFFFKDESGNCNISKTDGVESYRLQSSAQQERAENFFPSPAWIINGSTVKTTTCAPSRDNFTTFIHVMGPFTNQLLNYRRTVSLHDYISIKFMLILMNWCFNCSLALSVINEDGETLGSIDINETLIESPQKSKQQLCSQQVVDYRLSVKFQIEEQVSRQLLLKFEPKVSGGTSWAISTFIVVSGKCHKNCATCQGFSPNLGNCRICKNFFSIEQQTPCKGCRNGFKLSQKQDRCQKCPIQFLNCAPKAQQTFDKCHYADKPINNENCSFLQFPATYFDTKYATSQQFFGSLFTIEGKGSSVFTCGSYSMIGLADKGDIIKRTFLTLPPHTQISITANIFIVDQETEVQKYTFLVFLQGERIDELTKNVLMVGTSNECGQNNKVQSFETFGPTNFYPHIETENVVIGIGGDSLGNMAWGIRDIRIAFRACDDKCLTCTENGCEVCPKFFLLKNYQCSDCIAGMGLFQGKCQFCVENCRRCFEKNSCQRCFIGFYIFTTTNGNKICKKNPNYRSAIEGKDGWNSTKSQPLPPTPSSIENCTTIGLQNNSSTYNFILAENRMIKEFKLSSKHFKVKIEFVLMKIDEWDPNDILLIYANDLQVRELSFDTFGNRLCGNEEQVESIRFEEIILKDDNETMTIQFQVVNRQNAPKDRKFGISRFKIYPISCSACQASAFNYKISYTIDQAINILMEFNRIYNTDKPEDFQKIFYINVNGTLTNEYDILFNDGIRYWLRYEGQTKELIQRQIKVICLYPEQVRTNIQNQKLFDKRLLQSLDPQSIKTLDNTEASVNLLRFTPMNERVESLSKLRTFFDIITRVVIYGGFISFFVGCQTGCTHMMHNLQKIWIHVYVASLAISPILKYSLLGFRECQNQNIAINPAGWQMGLPQVLYYDVAPQFQLYYEDTTFFRNIYSIGVACLILVVVYLIGYLLFRNSLVSEDSFALKHLKITFSLTHYFYWNSVIFYQYFTVIIACCLQFLDLRSRLVENDGFAGINAAACIIAFILATLYPIFHFLYMRRMKKMINDDNKIDEKDKVAAQTVFKNKYAEIFYRFMKLEYTYISDSRFLYNVFRFGELWWIGIVAILLHHSAFIQAFILMLLNGFHFFFILFSSFNKNKIFRVLKALELLFFVGLEILILVTIVLLDTLTTQSYETLGIVGVVFLFMIIGVSIVRMIYIWMNIVAEYRESENSYRRNLMFYDEDRLGSEIQFD